MLAIARALVRDPKIILLTSPSRGLLRSSFRIWRMTCRELARSGQTIVPVEQIWLRRWRWRSASTSSTTAISSMKARLSS